MQTGEIFKIFFLIFVVNQSIGEPRNCSEYDKIYNRAKSIIDAQTKYHQKLREAGLIQHEDDIGYNEQHGIFDSNPSFGNTKADILTTAAALISDSNATDLSGFSDLAACSGNKNTELSSNPKYRPIDGYGNNLKNPLWGTAMSHFGRQGPKTYADGVNSVRKSKSGRDLPSPRKIVTDIYNKVSKKVRTGTVPTQLLNFFVLYISHDMGHQVPVKAPYSKDDVRCCTSENKEILSPVLSHSSCLPIPIPENDEFYGEEDIGCLNMVRSQLGSASDGIYYGEVLNKATAYLDHSLIYGTTEKDCKSVRKFKGGLLNVTSKNMLPVKSDGKPLESSLRLTQVPMGAMWPILFARNHNKLAEGLASVNPTWDDEKLFQEARRINIAVFQRGIYGGKIIESVYRKPVNETYDDSVDPSTTLEFSTAAYRFPHYYLQSHMRILKEDGEKEEIPLSDTLGRMDLMEKNFDEIVAGTLNQTINYGEFSDELYNKFNKNSKGKGLDLISTDIQRGRDHGLPTFLEMRKTCGLEANYSNFEDLKSIFPQSYIKVLKETYESVEDIDLLVGGTLESFTTIDEFITGLTVGCSVGYQYKLTMAGDTYFYTHKTGPHPFTDAQLNAIDNYAINNVICQNSKVQSIPRTWFLIESPKNPRFPCSKFGPLDFSAFEGI